MKAYIIVLILLLIPTVYALSLDGTAKALHGSSSFKTAVNIYDYIYSEYGYEYNYYPKGVEQTFKDGSGDCTDYAELSVYLFKANGYAARTVHGYCDKQKHDWVQFKDGKNWINLDWSICKHRELKGVGVW